MLGFRHYSEQYNSLQTNSSSGQIIYSVSGFVTFTTGILLTVVRLFEPLFKLLVYKQIWQFWGEIYEPKQGNVTEEEIQIANDSLSTFLTSSLNVELVYIILESITAFADNDERKLNVNQIMTQTMSVKVRVIDLEQPDDTFKAEIARDCDVKRLHILKEIEIKNVDKWDSAKAKDFVTSKLQTGTEKVDKENGKQIEKDLSIQEEVKITEYAPSVFQTVKFMDGITPEMIKESLSTEKNHKSVFKAKESAGKSGSFFFFSFDRKFIIKTMNSSEKKVFIDSLPTYMQHLR